MHVMHSKKAKKKAKKNLILTAILWWPVIVHLLTKQRNVEVPLPILSPILSLHSMLL